jgi:hypothetical protein
MDYTLSNSYVTDTNTAQRMHLQAQAVPTAVSDADLNQLIWEAMEIVKAAGLVGAPFDKATPATYQKLLTALRSAGVFQTAPQFDNTTKAATSAFVKAQGLQGSGLTTVAVTSTLTAAVVGGTVLIASAAATTQTLPLANAVPAGARIEFMNTSTGLGTVQRAGADTLIVNNTSVTGLPLGIGDTLTLASNGVNGWLAVNGTANLVSSAMFGRNLAGAGFQRLPGGLIMQWVRNFTAITTAGGDATIFITYPVTFLSAVFGSAFVVCNEANALAATACAQGTSMASLSSTAVYVRGGGAGQSVAVSGLVFGV